MVSPILHALSSAPSVEVAGLCGSVPLLHVNGFGYQRIGYVDVARR
ncbi:hypothetical protein M2432_001496 [Mycobacterium sp. OTB74]|nr:hypothetical protein [Mycobacterium sp. OTB74]